MNKHLEFFSELKGDLKDAPKEVKESYNKLIKYFDELGGKIYPKDDDSTNQKWYKINNDRSLEILKVLKKVGAPDKTDKSSEFEYLSPRGGLKAQVKLSKYKVISWEEAAWVLAIAFQDEKLEKALEFTEDGPIDFRVLGMADHGGICKFHYEAKNSKGIKVEGSTWTSNKTIDVFNSELK